MAYRIFLDANVILEFILKRKQASVVEVLFNAIESAKYRGFTSTSILQICSYWMTKEFGVNTTKVTLLSMLKYVSIIDSKHEFVMSALHSPMGDIEDALQYYTALQHKIDYFITLDKQLIREAIPSLPIYLPADFLRIYSDFRSF